MSMVALDTAFDLLKDNQDNATTLQITGFEVGDAYGFEVDTALTSVQGNLVYSGILADMKFVPFSTDSVVIQCVVEHDKPEMTIGNILLKVNDQPFALYVAERVFKNTKLQSHDSAVGIRYTVQMILTIPAIMTRMSFVNLTSGVAVFKSFNGLETLDNFYQTEEDQAVLNEYRGRMVPLVNMVDGWYGCPLAMHMDDTGFWKLSGGVVGDNYDYVKDQ